MEFAEKFVESFAACLIFEDENTQHQQHTAETVDQQCPDSVLGAGGAAGQNDAANLLKPALARGQLRCIGATTWSEYTKYFEKDPALARRFQNINVDEPDDDKAIQMLRGTAGKLENHHNVIVLDEAISSAVKQSRRYIPARQLPDKAVSVLDTACAGSWKMLAMTDMARKPRMNQGKILRRDTLAFSAVPSC